VTSGHYKLEPEPNFFLLMDLIDALPPWVILTYPYAHGQMVSLTILYKMCVDQVETTAEGMSIAIRLANVLPF
jgi:hypothetical protein